MVWRRWPSCLKRLSAPAPGSASVSARLGLRWARIVGSFGPAAASTHTRPIRSSQAQVRALSAANNSSNNSGSNGSSAETEIEAENGAGFGSGGSVSVRSSPPDSPLPQSLKAFLSQFAELAETIAFDTQLSALRGMRDLLLDYYSKNNGRAIERRMIHNTYIKGCARLGEFEAAVDGFSALQSDRDSEPPSARSFSKVIQTIIVSERNGSVNEALKWEKKMNLSGIESDLATHNLILLAHVNAGDVESAEARLDLMTEIDEDLPDEVSFTTIAKAYAELGDFNKAEYWFREMERRGRRPDSVAYGTIILACAKKGDFSRARMWIGYMQEAGLELNSTVLNSVLNASSELDDHQEFENLVKLAEGAEVNKNAIFNNIICNIILKHKAKTSTSHEDIKKTIQKLTNQHNFQPDAPAYNAIIRFYLGNPNLTPLQALRDAEIWLKEMKKNQVKPSHITYTTFIQICGAAGKFSRAEAIMRILVKKGMDDAVSYRAIVAAAVDCRELARADAWRARMGERGHCLDARGYMMLCAAYSRLGDAGRAYAVIEEMKEKGMAPNVYCYTNLIKAYSRARGHPGALAELAKKRWQEMERENLVPNVVTFFVMIKLMHYSRRTQDVRYYLKKFKESGLKADSKMKMFLDKFGISLQD